MAANVDRPGVDGGDPVPDGPMPEGMPRPQIRMLLSSAGRRVALLRAFRSSAAALGVDLEVFATDLRPEWSSACIEADFAFAMPPATSPDFIEAVLALCEREAITLVVPTIDTELLAFADHKRRFDAIGTMVAVSGSALVAMSRDKLATAHFLAAAGIRTPRTAALEAVLEAPSDWDWPLMAKPRHGSSSRGISIVRSFDDLAALAPHEPYVAQTLLRGGEYTVNMFFDERGRLRSAVPHERIAIRGGEVEKGCTLRHGNLCEIARQFAAAVDRPFGALCFQAIVSDQGEASIFEVNARFGGGYPLSHHAGATFARWLIELRLGWTTTANDSWRSGVVMLRYDDAVFV